jgi:hypothetical protein
VVGAMTEPATGAWTIGAISVARETVAMSTSVSMTSKASEKSTTGLTTGGAFGVGRAASARGPLPQRRERLPQHRGV